MKTYDNQAFAKHGTTNASVNVNLERARISGDSDKVWQTMNGMGLWQGPDRLCMVWGCDKGLTDHVWGCDKGLTDHVCYGVVTRAWQTVYGMGL